MREIDKAREVNFPDQNQEITKIIYSIPSLLHIDKLKTPRGFCTDGSSDADSCSSGSVGLP